MKADLKFPVNIFPPLLKRIISETNSAYSFPVSYIGSSLLIALSTAIGNSCCLRVNRTRVERGIIYLHLVGEPGSVKSHPLRFALGPIIERDIKVRQEYSEKYRQYQGEVRSGGSPVKPKCRQRIVQDVTIEGLMKILADNPIGVCFFCDEATGFLGNLNRYHAGGNDENKILSIFNCLPIFIDRSGMDEKLTIATPFVNIAATIQPKVFARYYSGRLQENGLLCRIMAIYNDGPDEMPFDSDNDIPQELIDQWKQILQSMLDYEKGYYELGEAEYSLTEDAKAAYSSWSDITTERMNSEEPVSMREFFQKIKSYVYRTALVLQVLEEVCENKKSEGKVGGHSMIKATIFGNYLLENARKTLDIIPYSNEAGSAKYRELLAFLPSSFTKSEANAIAEQLQISESTVDKFCKEQQGITIRKTAFGKYEKIPK